MRNNMLEGEENDRIKKKGRYIERTKIKEKGRR